MIAHALARGATHAEAAQAAGVSAKTVQRRTRHEPFAHAVSSLRRQRVESITAKLIDASDEAVATVCELLQSGGRPVDRLRAANILLTQTSRYHGHTVEHETLDRLERLESQINTDQPGGQP